MLSLVVILMWILVGIVQNIRSLQDFITNFSLFASIDLPAADVA